MQLLVFCLSCYFPWRALELTRRGPNSIASVCQHDHPTALDMRLHTIFAMTLTCNARTHWQYLIWPVPVSLLIYLLVSQRCFFAALRPQHITSILVHTLKGCGRHECVFVQGERARGQKGKGEDLCARACARVLQLISISGALLVSERLQIATLESFSLSGWRNWPTVIWRVKAAGKTRMSEQGKHQAVKHRELHNIGSIDSPLKAFSRPQLDKMRH